MPDRCHRPSFALQRHAFKWKHYITVLPRDFANSHGQIHSHSISSIFFENLTPARLECSEVSNVLMISELYTVDGVIIPVNVNRNHWIVATVYMKAKCVVVADSLRSHDRRKSIFQKMIAFLHLHAVVNEKYFKVLDWVLINPRTVAQQTDNNSCGVFACINGYNSTFPPAFFTPKPNSLMHLRYCSIKQTVVQAQSITYPVDKSLIENQEQRICIRDAVPGR